MLDFLYFDSPFIQWINSTDDPYCNDCKLHHWPIQTNISEIWLKSMPQGPPCAPCQPQIHTHPPLAQ